MSVQTQARGVDLATIVDMLKTQQVRRLDLVTSASAFSAQDGHLFIEDGDAATLVTSEGVSSAAGLYKPTSLVDSQLGSKLKVPADYLKALRAEGRFDLYDANVNGKLHGLVAEGFAGPEVVHPPMDGKYLLRLLKGDEGEPGVVRAVLSPRYRIMDNYDVLLAVMAGIQQAGVPAIPGEMNLSDQRLYAEFEAPDVAALAPKLLDGYRSPFDGPGGVKRASEDTPGAMRFRGSEWGNWDVPSALAAAAREGQGYAPGTEPVVWAGFVLSNSDVGEGARTITPKIKVRVCRNGLTLVAEADRKIHLGAEQAVGVVNWSAETQEDELRLITSQARDAVATYLSQDFLNEQVARIEAMASAPVANPEVTIKEVAKSVGFTQAEAEGILDHFLRGGAYTSGGVANAVTSYSQTLASPDRANDLDAKAIKAMELAARS